MPHANAGLEHKQFSAPNDAVLSSLHTSILKRRGGKVQQLADRAPARLRRSMPEALGACLPDLPDAVRYRNPAPDLLAWSDLPAALAEHGPRMRELASRTAVVKDPRFAGRWEPGWPAAPT